MTGQHRLRPTTLNSYEKAIERVTRRLGKVPVQVLTPLQVEKFYAGLLRDGARRGKPLSAKTLRNSHVGLRKALADAERLGLVFRNAAASARPPTAAQKELNTWSSDDLRDFFAGIRDDRIFPALVVLATTGMRRGEALGLRGSDVNLDAGQLAIVQTLTTINGKPTFGGTKSLACWQRWANGHDLSTQELHDAVEVLTATRSRERENDATLGRQMIDDAGLIHDAGLTVARPHRTRIEPVTIDLEL